MSNPRIQDISSKIQREQKVLDGAQKMMSVASDEHTLQMCLVNIQDAQARINYLETELKKLAPDLSSTQDSLVSTERPAASINVTHPKVGLLGGLLERLNFTRPSGKSGSSNSLSSPESDFPVPLGNFDYLKFGNTITPEQIKFRLWNVKTKLDLEKKVKSGTENLIAAMAASNSRMKAELEDKITEANLKISILSKSEHKYTELYLDVPDTQDEDLYLSDNKDRRTGRIIMKLVGAINIASRKSLKDDIVAVVKIDGSVKYTSRATKSRWDENMNIQVDRSLEMEILVKEKNGPILATSWFKLSDLEAHLDIKYGKTRQGLDMDEIWLDLEPSGQLSFKINFVGIGKTKTQTDRVFRRDAVQKVYPRNGHRFVAQQFYQVMQCALCNEFLGRSDYQCQSCHYAVHARCYQRVITKCIDCHSPDFASLPKEAQNTGQLLKYNIPHRWDVSTNIGAAWCGHCGHMIPPARKVHRCSECNKVSHKECSPMIPAFCGLAPFVADQLVAAFEEHEKKLHAKELEEAENARKLEKTADASTEKGDVFANDFSDILGQIRNQEVSPVPTLKRDPTVKTQNPSKVELEDFALHSVLGRGAFGKVMLVSEKSTGSYFAMKALKKEFIVKNDDVQSTKLEKSIFQIASASRHPFLVNLHSCFHSDTRIYFVMEYVPGGDLMTHIQDKRRFSQVRTKFYACEVLLALEYLHMNKIIYRDLKLDNILLGSDGHIKLADYGICKSGMSFGDLTSTFCGTPDYMAVEVLLNKKYGLAVDWWSFGILIYVMLIGKYPFHGDDENEILDAILSDAIEFPPSMPPVTLSLIQALLNKNPARRLGGGSADAEEVRRHAYFTGVDWNAILQKSVQPAYVPIIENAEDVSNFDKTFTGEDPVLTPMNSVLNDLEQREFEDFTFVSEWAIQSRLKS